MTYEIAAGLRYLKSRRRQTFISLITVISVGGVAVGVMVLIVVLAVMSGFETSLKDKILGINSHIWILPQTPGRLTDYQDIVTRARRGPCYPCCQPWDRARERTSTSFARLPGPAGHGDVASWCPHPGGD